MAKLAITLFAVLLLVANAYAHRTTITTIEIDEGQVKTQSSRKCQQQIDQCDLSQCERFITRSEGRGIEMVRAGGKQQKRPSAQSLQQCCSQIHQLDDKCQCRALEQIIEEGQEEGQMDGQQQQQMMMERAQTVVTYCRLPQRCQWQSV